MNRDWLPPKQQLAIGERTGGRHRAATFALALQAVLSGDVTGATELGVKDLAQLYSGRGLTVHLVHRDLDKDVVDR
ncbi:hypothetical protein DN051_40235 [Streptomyces cadmiisoli]|uniref:Uncharacterized protein n=1 Tax=Streptomyces cadmiisoli TaxID=2184053 RepID=A0A2Z4JCH0_9ACTN|nr:hypothetical protein DN051_00575 [Streptomyces cadmiisoli]AWW42063.1 hypothetical protein DN051_40235 [Streptomyces cadmiisoli]